MEKIFENTVKLTRLEDYEKVLLQVKILITEATENGALDDPEADNEYIREIGRLSHLGSEYENEYVKFEHIKVRKKSLSIKKYRGKNVDSKLLVEYA